MRLVGRHARDVPVRAVGLGGDEVHGVGSDEHLGDRRLGTGDLDLCEVVAGLDVEDDDPERAVVSVGVAATVVDVDMALFFPRAAWPAC
jgi:hypothetical protein